MRRFFSCLTKNVVPSKESSIIQFPNHRTVAVPFSTGYQFKTLLFPKEYGEITFEIEMAFPVDGILEDYFIKNITIGENPCLFKKNGVLYAVIGYINLCVTTAINFTEYSFFSSTSAMSRLLVESPSVKASFYNILKLSGCLMGLLDKDNDNFQFFWDNMPNIHIEVDDFYCEKIECINIDRFVQKIMCYQRM